MKMMFDKQTRQNKTNNLKMQVTRRVKEGAEPSILLNIQKYVPCRQKHIF